jgi:hypothetical protein
MARDGDLNNLIPFATAEWWVCLIVVAPIFFAIKYWYVVLPILVFAVNECEAENAQRRAKIVARADKQHAATMKGDHWYGTYGDYPPAVAFPREKEQGWTRPGFLGVG